jgi:hypothetical protein
MGGGGARKMDPGDEYDVPMPPNSVQRDECACSANGNECHGAHMGRFHPPPPYHIASVPQCVKDLVNELCVVDRDLNGVGGQHAVRPHGVCGLRGDELIPDLVQGEGPTRHAVCKKKTQTMK